MVSRPSRRTIPIALGLAMLAVVIAAALTPNTGTVAAASNCAYGQCPSSKPAVPVWEIATIGAVVVLGALIGLFLLIRRRRRPPAPGVAPPSEGGPVPPAGAGEIAGGPAGPPPGEGSAAYIETPEDVGRAPPTLGSAPAAGESPPGPEPEPDIDSLMAELDKISGEILKRTPKKPPEPPSADESGPTDST